MVTDQTGAVQQDARYYPWGQAWSRMGPNYDTHFAGMQQPDSLNDFYPTPFRRYHARLYRWLSPDPLAGDVSNPQSLNRYAYVMNNPTTLIDPNGLGSGPPTALVMCLQFGNCPDPSLPSFGCTVNGAATSCGLAYGVLASGAGVQCPNNLCEGMLSGPGVWLPVKFDPNTGYYSCLVPGEYGTPNGAGIAAVGCTNDVSIGTNTEFGGNIYKMANGKYSFTGPQVGTVDSVDIDPTIPQGTVPAGDYHTHGAYDPHYDSEIFSAGGPGTDIYGNNVSGLPGYLGTPSRRVEVYNPSQAGQFPFGCVLVGPPVSASPGVPACP